MAQVQSLVGELRSCKPWGQSHEERERERERCYDGANKVMGTYSPPAVGIGPCFSELMRFSEFANGVCF